MTGKVALVTGCSTGVGLHTAIRLAEAGYSVVATMRDVAKQQALLNEATRVGVTVEVKVLDVCSQASIEAAVADVMALHGRIDLLVNNAGAGFLGSVEQTSDADLRRTMETNFFGVWNLTKAVLPHMRAAGSGRIISVTSVGGLLGQPFNEAYCAAKFAVEGMMEGLAPLAQQFGVQVCLVEPGPINTEFVASVRSSSQAALATMAEPYATLAQRYMAASGNVFATHGQTGDDIARIIAALAAVDSPDFRTITSDFAMATVASKVVDRTGNSVIEAFANRLKG
ncbi:SDR family oxidoreductase [Novosphingobium sp.]|uniref:SDR family oxidoreductase n=1 Tax=Novosphingobium sp. TaxID=1874826 RepID=UPI0025E9C9A4|nr:SDR family oxidoreductase [Novosphingobium sp.]MCC6925580.1 SDR family oxidoreductase [Novosphingobium sp.]